MKNKNPQGDSEGCVQIIIVGIIVIVMIPVGYIMKALGFSMGWVIGFGIILILISLGVIKNE